MQRKYVNGSIIVAFLHGTTEEKASQILKDYNPELEIIDFTVRRRIALVKVPDGQENKIIEDLKRLESIRYAELNYLHSF